MQLEPGGWRAIAGGSRGWPSFTERNTPMSRSATVTLLTTREAAAVLTITVSTLNAWRCRGGGPPWLKIGQCVRYDLQELKIWIDAQRQLPDRPQHRL